MTTEHHPPLPPGVESPNPLFCIVGWIHEIHRLETEYKVGLFSFTDNGREAMAIHAEMLKKAYAAVRAWDKFTGDDHY